MDQSILVKFGRPGSTQVLWVTLSSVAILAQATVSAQDCVVQVAGAARSLWLKQPFRLRTVWFSQVAGAGRN